MEWVFRRINKINKEDIVKGVIFVLLLSLIIVIFCQKIEFSSSDLGRHLANGQIVFSDPSVLFTNFYSYTEPNFPFVNHHWLSGVIYNIINQIGGFKLLSLFNILILLITFSLFFFLSKKKSNFYYAAILSLPVIFLLSERVEIRPELFSYLFFGLTWLILESKKLSHRSRLYILFPLFLVWANIHIYFFLGLALVFFYLFGLILEKYSLKKIFYKKGLKEIFLSFKSEIYLFLSLLLACLITPNHIRGLLYPLNILQEYGYQIAENKSIFFLKDLMLNYNFGFFKLLLFLLILSLVANYVLFKRKTWTDWLIGVMISVLALVMSRNLALFGLIALVLIAPGGGHALSLIATFFDKLSLRSNFQWKIYANIVFIVTLSLTFIFLLTDLNNRQMFLHKDPGLGLSQDSLAIFDYFKENNLKGPIFNNYDAGSALIYGLYGQEKVFVDNRPEAYSVSFFKDVYVPMQENPSIWQKIEDKYKFKTIMFAHTDATPWANTFMQFILQDEDWALVYFDRYYVVLVNRGEYSQEFIEENEISDLMFRDRLRLLASDSSLNAKFSLANLANTFNYDYLAKEIYQKIILTNPYNNRAIFSFASLYASLGNSEDLNKALDYYNRGLKVSPKMPGIYGQMGLVYWKLENYVKAEEYFKKALRKGDSSAKDYLQQIEGLKKEGKLPR